MNRFLNLNSFSAALIAFNLFLSSCSHRRAEMLITDSSAMDDRQTNDIPLSQKAKYSTKKRTNRKISSVGPSGSFATTAQNCNAYESASKGSKLVKTLAGGKQIWTEKSSNGWLKVFLKNSSAYVEANCFD